MEGRGQGRTRKGKVTPFPSSIPGMCLRLSARGQLRSLRSSEEGLRGAPRPEGCGACSASRGVPGGARRPRGGASRARRPGGVLRAARRPRGGASRCSAPRRVLRVPGAPVECSAVLRAPEGVLHSARRPGGSLRVRRCRDPHPANREVGHSGGHFAPTARRTGRLGLRGLHRAAPERVPCDSTLRDVRQAVRPVAFRSEAAGKPVVSSQEARNHRSSRQADLRDRRGGASLRPSRRTGPDRAYARRPAGPGPRQGHRSGSDAAPGIRVPRGGGACRPRPANRPARPGAQ